MLKFSTIIFVVVLQYTPELYAQNSNNYTKDFKILYECFRDDHPLRKYHIDSVDFYHKYEELRLKINESTSRSDFQHYCIELSKALGCLHTYVYTTETDTNYDTESVYQTKFNKASAYLKLSDFDGGRKEIKYFFKEVAKRNVDTILIDLRDNYGGNGNIGNQLLKYLIPKEIEYYLLSNIHKSIYDDYFERNAGFMLSSRYKIENHQKKYFFTVKPRKKYHSKAVLYVLINEHTLSTATYVSSHLKHTCKANVIGRTTAENEYQLGGGVIRTLVLPNTGIRIKFPNYAWVYGSLPKPSKTGVQPNMINLPENLRFF